jgi:hypothetical protein
MEPRRRPGVEAAALSMAASWMGSRFYRTFRVSDEPAEAFDALLTQRDRRIGVTIGLLWDPAEAPADPEFAELLASDLEGPDDAEAGYVVWVPPGATIPADEPARSDLRVLLGNGMAGLEPGERREVRIPVTLQLAKIQADGAYVSVTGGLSSVWTTISEGIEGAFHLDSRPVHRLPEQEAELEIIVSRVRDRAALLNDEEYTDVHVHDYWLVSRLPSPGPGGVVLVGGPPDVDPRDGVPVRRWFRRAVERAVEQRRAGDAELSVLILVGALAHIEEELVTAALKGMNPATYGALDLIVLVADGSVRQVLQPRSLPWEQERTAG